MRKTNVVLIATQNNAMRIYITKAKIDNPQQNCQSWLCGERDEMVNRIISECSKLAKRNATLSTTGKERWSTKI